jgi:hypothetical protein
VASQSSILAQDRYFPISEISEITRLFESDKATDIKVEEAIPSTNELILENQDLVRVFPRQVYTFAQVEFIIPKTGDAIVGVYNLDGKKVKSIAFNHFEAGTYKRTIQTRNLDKGVYFVKLQMEGYIETKRLTIAR